MQFGNAKSARALGGIPAGTAFKLQNFQITKLQNFSQAGAAILRE
jgi:hypothetical protein